MNRKKKKNKMLDEGEREEDISNEKPKEVGVICSTPYVERGCTLLVS
jgi:hypothetical protein